jgi:hypothetical protein
VIGLLLGFVIRAAGMGPETLLGEAVGAGLRSVVWFAAFGLLERIAWPGRVRLLVLAAGVVALLVNLTVSGGIAFPSVAVLLWAVIALAVNAAGTQEQGGEAVEDRHGVSRPARWVVALVLGAAALAYVGLIYYPVSSSVALVDRAQGNGEEFFKERREGKGPILRFPRRFVKDDVIALLEQASRFTPGDARVRAQLGLWCGELWRLELMTGDPESAKTSKRLADEGVVAVTDAQRLDPASIRGYMAEYQLRIVFAGLFRNLAEKVRKEGGSDKKQQERAERMESAAREQYRLAAEAMEHYLPHDPTDLLSRYHRAWALHEAGDRAGARQIAAKALLLSDEVTRTRRRLSARQLEQLRQWAEPLPTR